MPGSWRCLKRGAWAEGSGCCEPPNRNIDRHQNRGRDSVRCPTPVCSLRVPLSFGCDCDVIAGPILGNMIDPSEPAAPEPRYPVPKPTILCFTYSCALPDSAASSDDTAALNALAFFLGDLIPSPRPTPHPSHPRGFVGAHRLVWRAGLPAEL